MEQQLLNQQFYQQLFSLIQFLVTMGGLVWTVMRLGKYIGKSEATMVFMIERMAKAEAAIENHRLANDEVHEEVRGRIGQVAEQVAKLQGRSEAQGRR